MKDTQTAKQVARSIVKHENAVLAIILFGLIGVFGAASKGLTLLADNMINIALQSSIRGVAAIGQTFVILTAGIDLSVGGTGLLVSILGAALMTNGTLSIVAQPFASSVAVPIMLITATSVGALNGLAVSRTGIPPLIVTLSLWQVLEGAAFKISGGVSVAGLPSSIAFLGGGNVAGIPVPVIIFIVVGVIAYLVLQYTTFGQSLYAVGGNQVTTWLSGIKVKNVQLAAYAICGFAGGLAGLIMTSRAMSASMLTLEGLELDSIAAAVVGGVSLAGGKGNIIGVMIGSLIIGVISNGMSVMGTLRAVRDIVTGIIIFAAVAIDYLRRR